MEPTGHQLLDDAVVGFVTSLAGLVRETDRTSSIGPVRGISGLRREDRHTTSKPSGSDSRSSLPMRPPAELWDLHESSSRSLRATGKLRVVVPTSYCSLGRDSRFRELEDCKSENGNSKVWELLDLYVLTTLNNSGVPWKVALTTATDTVNTCQLSSQQGKTN